MIINRMILTNFFRFYPRQEIVFSNATEKNVTIIRGENGSGKTTLLNAFYWCFYGDVTDPLTPEKMLNDMAEAKLKEGEITESSVEIIFEDKGTKYTILRKQRFMRKNSNVIKLGVPELNISYTNEKGNEEKIEDPDFFSSIIPEKLRGFFFFDGERINRLAKIDGKEEIKKAILDILGLTNLEMIKKDLEVVNAELTRDIKKYMQVNEVSLSDNLTALIEEKNHIENQIAKKQQDIHTSNGTLKSINEFLEQHNSEMVRKKQAERKSLENDISTLEKRIEDCKRNLLIHISKNFKKFLAVGMFDEVSSFLESKRKKGELPSDIKLTFVNDLLERKRCVCGRSLAEGTEEYQVVANMRKTAGRTELDDAYTRIMSFINFVNVNEKENFYSQYESISKREVEFQTEKEIKEKKLSSISHELKNAPEEKIREYENLRENTQSDIARLNREIGALDLRKQNTENEITKLNQKLQQTSLANEQAQQIQKYLSEVQQLGQLNNEIQALFIKTTRENLDAKIKEVFAKMTRKDYRVPSLTEGFELKILSKIKNSDEPEVLSTGEGQITSLSFIGSLVSYAKEKERSSILSEFSGGDFPIVMDSPFGNLDQVHTANVAADIGNLASQVVIIVSDKQWSKEVEENIWDKVGKMWRMKDGDFGGENTGEYTEIKEVAL